MIDYSQWERKRIAVTNVNLDPHNPRVPKELRKNITQKELYQLFVENYDVDKLAKSISEKGFYPDEMPIVCNEKAYTIPLKATGVSPHYLFY